MIMTGTAFTDDLHVVGQIKKPVDHIGICKQNQHLINADAGFAYVVHIIYRNPVKQIVSIIDCRVRHLHGHAVEGAVI